MRKRKRGQGVTQVVVAVIVTHTSPVERLLFLCFSLTLFVPWKIFCYCCC